MESELVNVPQKSDITGYVLVPDEAASGDDCSFDAISGTSLSEATSKCNEESGTPPHEEACDFSSGLVLETLTKLPFDADSTHSISCTIPQDGVEATVAQPRGQSFSDLSHDDQMLLSMYDSIMRQPYELQPAAVRELIVTKWSCCHK